MDIWPFIEKQIGAGRTLVLIVVTQIKGSSPGRKGFKMAVLANGESRGSVGGGLMEYNLVKLALELLAGESREAFLKRQIHSPHAKEDASGLICAGEQTQAFIPLGPEDLDAISRIRQAADQGQQGKLLLSDKGITFKPQRGSGSSQPLKQVEIWYEEHIGPPDTLYLFGGGHISLSLSQIAGLTGFRVVVLDDRPGLPTMEVNEVAHQKKHIDYRAAASYIQHPHSSYVGIMTVSHSSDQMILEQMLGMPLKYLGMIGSKNKADKIFSNLRARGATEAALRKVESPMGIPIGGQTPAEIAVSILASLIKHRNN